MIVRIPIHAAYSFSSRMSKVGGWVNRLGEKRKVTDNRWKACHVLGVVLNSAHSIPWQTPSSLLEGLSCPNWTLQVCSPDCVGGRERVEEGDLDLRLYTI